MTRTSSALRPYVGAALAAAVALPALAACTSNTGSGGSDRAGSGAGSRIVEVTATDDGCTLSTDKAAAGHLTYRVHNAGSQVTEFYLYAGDGSRILGEVENIGPGLTRDLVVSVPEGSYTPTCKPGMKGAGIRSSFTVTPAADGGGATGSGGSSAQVRAATASYHAYVADQADQLLAGTRRFAAAYRAGDDEQARQLYPLVRVHWERIEPVAESFGDLDPRMDLREADLEPGQRWTGWHRLEKDLWPPRTGYRPLTKAQRTSYADRLVADTTTLRGRIADLELTVDQIGNGAKSLLDEVATGKVTGEEETWSHTDLYDFQANVDGARVAFEGLRPALEQKDPALEQVTARRFAALQRLLDQHRVGRDGFVAYDRLSRTEVRRLSDAVNALSEPLSRLTAAVAL